MVIKDKNFNLVKVVRTQCAYLFHVGYDFEFIPNGTGSCRKEIQFVKLLPTGHDMLRHFNMILRSRIEGRLPHCKEHTPRVPVSLPETMWPSPRFCAIYLHEMSDDLFLSDLESLVLKSTDDINNWSSPVLKYHQYLRIAHTDTMWTYSIHRRTDRQRPPLQLYTNGQTNRHHHFSWHISWDGHLVNYRQTDRDKQTDKQWQKDMLWQKQRYRQSERQTDSEM